MQHFFSENSLDDIMRVVLEEILKNGQRVEATKGGNLEVSGTLLSLENPRARLSRTETRGKLFSCLGELCWYLAGSDELEFIQYYIPEYSKEADQGVLQGAYGPRIFGEEPTQYSAVLELLQRKPATRRAVIQIYSPSDLLRGGKDVPCTCSLQFFVREHRLNLIATMRSSDVFLGLPHDVFCFTMLQEILATELSLEVGYYRHFAASLHLYDKHVNRAREFLDEGWQQTGEMPRMPQGNPWASINGLLSAENQIRVAEDTTPDIGGLEPYWADLVRLLQVFRHIKDREFNELRKRRSQLHSQVFGPYIDWRLSKQERSTS